MVCNDLTFVEKQSLQFEIPGILIRKMQLQDLDKVHELETKIFNDPWSRESFAYEIRNNPFSFLFVVEKDKEIIGYAVYWYLNHEAHIANLAIDQKFRRKKIGELLLSYLLNEMKSQNVRVVHLEVRRSNIAAQNLYLKKGFKITGVRKNYYVKGREDAVLMNLFLKEG